MIDPKSVGLYIKKQRETHQLTQNQLAESLGVEPQTISKWERGNGLPDINTIQHLAQLFHMSIENLLSGGTSDFGFESILEKIAYHNNFSLFYEEKISYKAKTEQGKSILDYCLIHNSLTLIESLKLVDPGFIIYSPQYEKIKNWLTQSGKKNLVLQLEEIEHKLAISYCPFCGSPLEGPNAYICDVCHRQVHVESHVELEKRHRKNRIIQITFPIITLTLLSNILYTTYYFQNAHHMQLSQQLELIHLYSDTVREGIDGAMIVHEAIAIAWQDQLDNSHYLSVNDAIDSAFTQNQGLLDHIEDINDTLDGLSIRIAEGISALHPNLYVLSQAIQIRYHLLFDLMYTANTTSIDQYLYATETQETLLFSDLDRFDELVEEIVL